MLLFLHNTFVLLFKGEKGTGSKGTRMWVSIVPEERKPSLPKTFALIPLKPLVWVSFHSFYSCFHFITLPMRLLTYAFVFSGWGWNTHFMQALFFAAQARLHFLRMPDPYLTAHVSIENIAFYVSGLVRLDRIIPDTTIAVFCWIIQKVLFQTSKW